jgi:hypothetical protein
VGLLPLAAVLAAMGAGAGGPPGSTTAIDKDDGSFGMTEPVACKEIRDFEDYVPLKEAVMTADEKLLVYYMPRHYKTSRVGENFQAHLVQDGRIRRRGEKTVLWSKARITDYKVRTEHPPRQIYIRNTISLKNLKPGDYEFDIILRDEVGQSAPATRSLPFKVIPSPSPSTSKGAQNNPGPAGTRPDSRN